MIEDNTLRSLYTLSLSIPLVKVFHYYFNTSTYVRIFSVARLSWRKIARVWEVLALLGVIRDTTTVQKMLPREHFLNLSTGQ
jgi:hypothetical protein